MKNYESEYDIQAREFCEKNGVKIDCVYTGHRKYFDDDDTPRATFRVTITNSRGSHSFDFGNSLADSYCDRGKKKLPQGFPYSRLTVPLPSVFGRVTTYYINGKEYSVTMDNRPPSIYTILACLYSPVGTFRDWCAEYGYNSDSIKDRETYSKCQELSAGFERIFTQEQLEELQEIQ